MSEIIALLVAGFIQIVGAIFGVILGCLVIAMLLTGLLYLLLKVEKLLRERQ